MGGVSSNGRVTYNNGYQESIKMNLVDTLYCRSCNTPISWSDPLRKVLIGLDLLEEMEQEMLVINRNLKETKDK